MLQTQSLQTSRADLLGGQNSGFGKGGNGSKSPDTGGVSFSDILANVGKSTSAQSSKPERNEETHKDPESKMPDSESRGAGDPVNKAADSKSVKAGDGQGAAGESADAAENGAAAEEAAAVTAGAELAVIMNMVNVQEPGSTPISEAADVMAAGQPAEVQLEGTVLLEGAPQGVEILQQQNPGGEMVTVSDGVQLMSRGEQPEAVQQAQRGAGGEAAIGQEAAVQGAQQADVRQQVPQAERGDAPQQQMQQNRQTDGSRMAGQGEGTGNSAAKGTVPQAEVRRDMPQAQVSVKGSAGDQKVIEENTLQPQMQAPVSEEITVTVKVSDGATLTQQLPKDVGNAVAQQLSQGAQEFNITLNPENLGKISIKLILDNGRVTVLMNASEEATQKMLSMNSGAIKQIIEESTGQETRVEVQNAEESGDEYREKENENEREGQERDQQTGENREGGSDESGAASFIQQLRLGLINGEENAS